MNDGLILLISFLGLISLAIIIAVFNVLIPKWIDARKERDKIKDQEARDRQMKEELELIRKEEELKAQQSGELSENEKKAQAARKREEAKLKKAQEAADSLVKDLRENSPAEPGERFYYQGRMATTIWYKPSTGFPPSDGFIEIYESDQGNYKICDPEWFVDGKPWREAYGDLVFDRLSQIPAVYTIILKSLSLDISDVEVEDDYTICGDFGTDY